jgi:predicted amidohydrolase
MEDQTFRISRRELLQLSSVAAAGALTLGPAEQAAEAAPAPPQTAASASRPAVSQLILMQLAWSGRTAHTVLAPALAAVRGAHEPEVFVLLPLGEGGPGKTTGEADANQQLAAIAREYQIYLAGAAPMKTADGIASIGFIFGPDGKQWLRTPKYTPDFMTGFSDSTVALGKAGAFPVADTPIGRFGMLIGEDILYGSHARALHFNGAEVILNPAVEIANEALVGRTAIPFALSVQNAAYIASATPARRMTGAFEERLPTRTMLIDWNGVSIESQGDETAVFATLDIERLRQARVVSADRISRTPQAVLLVRDALYAPLFKSAAERLGRPAAPSSVQAWRDEAAIRISAQAKGITHPQREDSYHVLMAQTGEIHSVRGAPDRKAEIARITSELLASVALNASRPSARLIVFPEFAFSGAGWRTVEDIRSVALTFPGKELDQVCAFAQKNRIYVAFQQLEADDRMPGHVFDTVFLVSDSGDILLRHRKMQCADLLGTLPDTTPGSVFDRYVDTYGLDSMIQVADTPIGKIGTTICAENMFPEIAQLLVQKGAEILTHSTSEGFQVNPRYGWNTARQLMALTGVAYLISTDAGDVSGGTFQQYRPAGQSHLIDYNGTIQVLMEPGSPGVLLASVDLAALRRARQNPRRNIAIWDDPRIYADAYTRGRGVPNNLWTNPDVFPYANQRVAVEVLSRRYETGVYVRPFVADQGAKG